LICVKARPPLLGDNPGMSERPLIDPAAESIISLAAETKYAANGIVSRTILRTPNSRVVLFGFAEGQELTEHTAAKTGDVVLRSGRGSAGLGDDVQEARAGTWVHMPANLKHSIKAKTPVVMLLVLLK
jgi:quercetin dioxygenase-like cupin family protein